jgi:hypothetical protein
MPRAATQWRRLAVIAGMSAGLWVGLSVARAGLSVQPAAAESASASASVSPVKSSELFIGDAAPALALSGMVRGEAAAKLDGGSVTVLAFWATWSREARASVRLLNALAQEPGVRVLAISGPDARGESAESARERVEKMDPAPAFDVAIDEGRRTRERYLDASGLQGIPTVFVVDGAGRLAWTSQPGDGDDPAMLRSILGRVRDGTWDLARARRLREAEQRVQELAEVLDFEPALPLIDELLEAEPGLFKEWAFIRFQVMRDRGAKEAVEYARKAVPSALWNSADALNSVAWFIAAEAPKSVVDLDLALKAAERASELTKHENAAILDTLAKVWFERGEAKKAFEWQTRAVARLDREPNREEYEARLKQYRTAAGIAEPDEASPAPSPAQENAPAPLSGRGGNDENP